jgi:putative transposase
MVKNHKLAKSISDAAWSQFAQWLQYFGKVYGKTVVAVAPQYTSQDCSSCGNRVQKSLSVRTHKNNTGCGKLRVFRPEREATRAVLTAVVLKMCYNSVVSKNKNIYVLKHPSIGEIPAT